MRLYTPSDIPNMLDSISLTSSAIENQVSRLEYHNYEFRGAEGKLPIESVPPFYRIILRTQRIPTQDEYWKECLFDMLLAGFNYENQNDSIKNGIKARIQSRTYPSLIRDVHFCKLLSESFSKERYSVFYNTMLDIQGIDVLLKDNSSNALFGICLFLNTTWAKKQVLRKRANRIPYYNVKYVEFPINPPIVNNDGIWLYGVTEVMALSQLLQDPSRYLMNLNGI